MDTRDNLLWLHICSYWSTVNKQTWQTQSRAWKVDTISATNSSECLLFSLFFFMVCVSSILCYHPLNQHFNTHYSKYSLFTVINLKSQEKYIERGREKHDREIKIERLCVCVCVCHVPWVLLAMMSEALACPSLFTDVTYCSPCKRTPTLALWTPLCCQRSRPSHTTDQREFDFIA